MNIFVLSSQAQGSLNNKCTVKHRKEKPLMSACKANRFISVWLNFNQVKHTNAYIYTFVSVCITLTA